MTNKLILATSSPHRKRTFSTLGINFVAEGSDVDEYFDGRPESPGELVLHLSQLKAKAVAGKHSEGIVVGFDSVAYFQGEILEKPKSREEAYQRLKRLSGQQYDFYTGIYMINLETSGVLTDVVKTGAWFRDISDDEINKYLDQDDMFNTYALGFSLPEHYSASFIKRVDGCFNNICWGLPLGRMIEMLKEIGYEFKRELE